MYTASFYGSKKRGRKGRPIMTSRPIDSLGDAIYMARAYGDAARFPYPPGWLKSTVIIRRDDGARGFVFRAGNYIGREATRKY